MFFELSIIPILFLILGYGLQIEKIGASYYLVFYSIFTIFPFIYIFVNLNYFNSLVYVDYLLSYEFILFFSIGFLIKFPVYYLHFWLPKAHVEVPTSASILLAGLLLKFGTLGFSRFLYSYRFLSCSFLFFLSFFGIILCCFICAFQRDAKALVAYSSVVHISFLLIIFILLSLLSKNSRLFIILAHGYSSVVLFYIVGLFFHLSFSRLIYFINSSFLSSLVLFSFISLFLLFNRGLLLSLRFFSEFLGVLTRVLYVKILFTFFFVYFFFSFYYSLYFLVNFSLGRSFFRVGSLCFLYIVSYLFYSFNIFFIFSF
jgi:NADH:ubiquinone oxidoreductase subunit 4 (subunit M)